MDLAWMFDMGWQARIDAGGHGRRIQRSRVSSSACGVLSGSSSQGSNKFHDQVECQRRGNVAALLKLWDYGNVVVDHFEEEENDAFEDDNEGESSPDQVCDSAIERGIFRSIQSCPSSKMSTYESI